MAELEGIVSDRSVKKLRVFGANKSKFYDGMNLDEIEEETLVGSGGQADLKDNLNPFRLEYQIEIEEFKSQVNDLKSQNSEKSEKIGILETELKDSQKMIKDLQTKREHAISEIQALREKYGETPLNNMPHFYDGKKPDPGPQSGDCVLYEGKNLRNQNSKPKPDKHSRKNSSNSQNQQYFDANSQGNQALEFVASSVINTTNLGLGSGPVKHIYVINPEKLNVFCKGLFKELKAAYIGFVTFSTSNKADTMVEVEKRLNLCMQKVRDFECYVEDKFTHLNIHK